MDFGCPLSSALGGVALGLNVLVSGKKGSGKSTLCAELAANMARDLGGFAYWLDREQSKDLVNECFARTGSPMDRVRYVGRDPSAGRDEGTWVEALSAIGPDAVVVVVDSLQRWAQRDAEQAALLDAAKRSPITFLVISHSNKQGQAAGQYGNQHDCDATVRVLRKAIVLDGSRWTQTPRKWSRASVAPLSNRGEKTR